MKHIGRKLYHILGGLGLLSLSYLLQREHALLVYGALALTVLALDVTRLRTPAFNRFIFSRFGSFVRPGERDKLTGTGPYVLGIGLSFLLFRHDIATAAVCYLAVGDVAATTIGERYGRTKIGDKSLEGTAAFFAAALVAGVLLVAAGSPLMPGIMAAGALVAAVVEVPPLPVNDNLVIPLVSGGVMELAVRLTAGP